MKGVPLIGATTTTTAKRALLLLAQRCPTTSHHSLHHPHPHSHLWVHRAMDSLRVSVRGTNLRSPLRWINSTYNLHNNYNTYNPDASRVGRPHPSQRASNALAAAVPPQASRSCVGPPRTLAPQPARNPTTHSRTHTSDASCHSPHLAPQREDNTTQFLHLATRTNRKRKRKRKKGMEARGNTRGRKTLHHRATTPSSPASTSPHPPHHNRHNNHNNTAR